MNSAIACQPPWLVASALARSLPANSASARVAEVRLRIEVMNASGAVTAREIVGPSAAGPRLRVQGGSHG